MAPRTPTLTIGLPVFNGEPFLGRTIESLLDQTLADFSILVSDNCSTDETRAICEQYARLDQRIRYLRQAQNIGAVGNYNFTFTASAGRYFKWAAADDICHPDYLRECVDVLDSDPEVVLCHSLVRLIDEFDRALPYDPTLDRYVDSSGRLRIGPNEQPMATARNPVARFKDAIRKTPPCFDVFGVFRREALAKTSLLQSWYGSDRVLLIELALHGRLHRVNRELFLGREHGGQSIVLPRREQARWIGLRLHNLLMPANLQFRYGLASAVMRAPLGLKEKIECLAFLCGRSSFRTLLHGRSSRSHVQPGRSLSREPER